MRIVAEEVEFWIWMSPRLFLTFHPTQLQPQSNPELQPNPSRVWPYSAPACSRFYQILCRWGMVADTDSPVRPHSSILSKREHRPIENFVAQQVALHQQSNFKVPLFSPWFFLILFTLLSTES